MGSKTKAQLLQDIEALQQRIAELEAGTEAGSYRDIETLAVLQELASLMTAGLDMEQILDSIYKYVSRLIDTTNFYVALYDAERNELFFPLDIINGKRVDRGALLRRPFGKGLTEYVILSQKPLLVKEDLAAARASLGIEAVGKLGALSWLGVPMIASGKVIGVITVQSYEKPRLYDERHRDMLVAIASLAAVALQNAELFEARQRQLEEMRVLNEIGQALSFAMDMEQVLETIHAQLGRLFDVRNFYIATYAEGDPHWTLEFNVESGARKPKERHGVGEGLTGYIIRTREPLLLRTEAEDRGFARQQGLPRVGQAAKSWMGVPLVAANKVVGVMGIESYEQENLYNEGDLALFYAVASQAAISLENARLLQQMGQNMRELEAAYARYTQETWQTFLESENRPLGYRYRVDVEPTAELSPEAETALAHNESIVGAVPEAESGATQTVRSALAVPIRLRNQVLGVLNLRFEGETVPAETVALVEQIADQLALSLENARLVEETQRTAANERLVGEITTRMRERLDVAAVLQTATRELQQALSLAQVEVRLGSPPSTGDEMADMQGDEI